jgi:SPP1 family predicted phage head-tail adaptor
VRAGELSRRFRIEEPVNNEYDAAGHPIEKWRLFGMVWGELEELSASESDGTDGKDSAASLTVKIRYTRGVDSTMRLCFEDDKVKRTMGISGVTKDRKNREMVLTCREERG